MYVIEFMLTYARTTLAYAQSPANEATISLYVGLTLAGIFGVLLEWFLIVFATSLKGGYDDGKFLRIAAIVGAANIPALLILQLIFSPELVGWVFSAFQFCTSSLLFTYGIRKQTSQAPFGN